MCQSLGYRCQPYSMKFPCAPNHFVSLYLSSRSSFHLTMTPIYMTLLIQLVNHKPQGIWEHVTMGLELVRQAEVKAQSFTLHTLSFVTREVYSVSIFVHPNSEIRVTITGIDFSRHRGDLWPRYDTYEASQCSGARRSLHSLLTFFVRMVTQLKATLFSGEWLPFFFRDFGLQ